MLAFGRKTNELFRLENTSNLSHKFFSDYFTKNSFIYPLVGSSVKISQFIKMSWRGHSAALLYAVK